MTDTQNYDESRVDPHRDATGNPDVDADDIARFNAARAAADERAATERAHNGETVSPIRQFDEEAARIANNVVHNQTNLLMSDEAPNEYYVQPRGRRAGRRAYAARQLAAVRGKLDKIIEAGSGEL